MPLNLENLDEETRRYMKEELERDKEKDNLYISPRLSKRGREDYFDLFLEAISGGSASSFAEELNSEGRLKNKEKTKQGTKSVRFDAHLILAEGEFNRYYIRGLCRRAIEENISKLEIYRAKSVDRPRPESQKRIGKKVDPRDLLSDLRENIGVEPVLGVPSGPNSGISVKIPE